MSTPQHRSTMDPLPPPLHAPQSGFIKRLLGRLHVTGVFWFRIHAFGMRTFPEWAIGRIIILFTTFFHFALIRPRKALGSNLEVVLGPCGWWERQKRVYRTFWNFAWCLSERYERFEGGGSMQRTVRGAEIWKDVLESGKGLILVTAHIGHWEVGASMAPSDQQRHVHVVREEELDPRAQEFVRKMFAESGEQQLTMHFANQDPMLGMKMLVALRQGEIVALQGDRPRAQGRFHTVEAFGREMKLPLGPAALARTAGVPLLPVYVFRRGRHRSEVVFRPLIHVPNTPGEEVLHEAVEKMAKEVEWAIRQAPHQWFCFHEVWPETALRLTVPDSTSSPKIPTPG